MFLSRVRISNFRGILSLEGSFGPGLNVIVGENNIGKTAVLDAIRIALGPGSTGGDRVWPTKEDRHRDAHGNFLIPIRIDLWFSGVTEEEAADFIEALNPDLANQANATVSIHYEWNWNEETKCYSVERWGGDREATRAAVSEEALQSLRWTFLDALRDASAALAPGRYSRLAKLMNALKTHADEVQIKSIFAAANQQIEEAPLVVRALHEVTSHLTGGVGQELAPTTAIRASEIDFDRIASSLRMVLTNSSSSPEGESPMEGGAASLEWSLEQNGLGYNNIIYIATVLAELEATKDSDFKILLVEEPEAHLHPQLQTKLSDYLAKELASPISDPIIQPGSQASSTAPESHKPPVQVIVTTHSPTIASRVRPDQLRILHRNSQQALAFALPAMNGLNQEELAHLQRLLDVTRATMFFAKGIMFVEGITETLLIPILAQRLQKRLENKAVSVVPVLGVDFSTLAKLFGHAQYEMDIPVAIVTDSDPRKVIENGTEWTDDQHRSLAKPQRNPLGQTVASERINSLRLQLAGKPKVRVFTSSVTLEFDLAFAGDPNPAVMVEAWRQAHRGNPRSLTAESLSTKSNLEAKALHIWQEICLSHATVPKSAFAQQLAAMLDREPTLPFVVPSYISHAITFVRGEE